MSLYQGHVNNNKKPVDFAKQCKSPELDYLFVLFESIIDLIWITWIIEIT